jgi:hypothetical protein
MAPERHAEARSEAAFSAKSAQAAWRLGAAGLVPVRLVGAVAVNVAHGVPVVAGAVAGLRKLNGPGRLP